MQLVIDVFLKMWKEDLKVKDKVLLFLDG